MFQKKRKISFSLLIFAFSLVGLILMEGPSPAMPQVQRMVLPNKIVLLISEEHSLPFITLQLLVDSGSRKDPSGKEGLARLVAKGLLLGTSQRTVVAINE